MIPIVGVSLEEALLGFGGDDAELHGKEVTLTTSDVTGSQTAIFEYDPTDEDPQGDPPGPWDGYSLFTIDLSAVKDDIEALQATIAAIIAILQAHDPDYDPDETPPEDGVQGVVDEEEALENCRDAVIAKIQEYFPSFDPQTCQDLVDKIEEDEDAKEDAEEHEGYEFPKKPDGTDPTIDEILTLVATDPVTSNDKAVSFYYNVFVDGSDVPEHRNIYTAEGGDAWDGIANSGYCCYTVDGVEYPFTGGGYINGATGFHILSIDALSGGGGFTFESETWVYTGGTPSGFWRRNSTGTVSSAPLSGWGAPPYKVKNS